VQVLEGIQDPGYPAHGGGFGDGSLASQDLIQVFALDIVHDQVLALVGEKEVVGDAGQVGMPQAGQQARLASELLVRLGGMAQVLLDDDGDV